MASLQLQFDEIYKRVSEFLGWGSSPTGTDLTNAKAVVHRGYRRFIYPINAQTGKTHTWSFLVKHAVLNTDSGEWVYSLPADFSRIVIPFGHEVDSGYPRMQGVSLRQITQMRAGVDSTSFPHFYAIKNALYVKEIGTTYEVVFFETPNTNYRLNYAYVFRPIELSATTDLFVGGDFASEAILENCLAVAELEYDDTLGIHSQEAQRLTQQLIQADVVTIADSVGKNIDTGVRYIDFQRPLPLTETGNIYSS
jgi:hypothetical protein